MAGGLGAVALMSAVAVIILTGGDTRKAFLFGAGLLVVGAGTVIALFAGNLIAASPYAVELEPRVCLRLCAPMKSVRIAVSDLKKVKSSSLRLGYTVSLKRRYGLLTGFSIHRGFGIEGKELARALEKEIMSMDGSAGSSS